MTQEENPLGSDLQALLDGERNYDPSPHLASRDAVWSRVEATTGLAAAATAAVSASHASPKAAVVAAKTVSLLANRVAFAALGLVAGGVVGAVAHAKFAAPPVPPTPVLQISTVYVDRPVPVLPAPEMSAPVPSVAVPPAPTLASPPPTASGPHQGDLAKERELMDVARAAVASKHADTALRSLEQHAATFPRGALSEERDALWVQALAGAGRLAEARSRASMFHKRYPNSMLGAAVDAAVSPPP